MKKNIITSIAASTILLTLCACGESSATTQSSSLSEKQTSIAEQSSSAESSVAENALPADEIYDWHGLQLFCPAENIKQGNFVRKEDSGFLFWRGKYSGNDRIYYAASRSILAAKKLPQLPTLSEIPAYFDGELSSLFRKYFHTYTLVEAAGDKSFTRIVESQEEIKIGDYDFLRMSGKLHSVLTEDETTVVEVPFCALYSITDFDIKQGENVPIIIIAFSEGDDPASAADTQTFIDKAVENMKWDFRFYPDR